MDCSVSGSAIITRVDAVACDITSFQPLGKLICEEDITEFTAAVGMEELPAVTAGAQVSVQSQGLEN